LILRNERLQATISPYLNGESPNPAALLITITQSSLLGLFTQSSLLGHEQANQEIGVSTQHNIFETNQDTAEHSATSVQPIRSERIKQWRRNRPRSDALVLRAAPASIVEFRLKNCLSLSASSMPTLGFQRVTHRMNITHEHASYMNFTLPSLV
jgi:hypothetical protein